MAVLLNSRHFGTRYWGVVLFWALHSGTCLAQTWSLSPELILGRPLAVQTFLKGKNLAGRELRQYVGGGLTLYRHRAVPPDWAIRYGFPLTGFGFRRFYLDNSAELGHPKVLFRSFRGPFRTYGRGSLDYVSALGIAQGFRRYDYYTNPYNTLISTTLSAYAELGVGVRYALSDHFDLYGNLSLHHFSNGNFKRPNLGFNAVAGTLSIRYLAGRSTTDLRGRVPEAFRRHTVIDLVVFGGSERRVHYSAGLPLDSFYRGLRHPVAGLSVTADRRLNHKSSLGLGATLIYRTTVPVEVRTEGGRVVRVHPGFDHQHIRLGIYPSYTQHFGRVSIIVQPEFYVYQRGSWPVVKRMSQRLAFRYQLTDRVYGGIAVNARNFSVADFVEWRVGYRLPVRPKL